MSFSTIAIRFFFPSESVFNLPNLTQKPLVVTLSDWMKKHINQYISSWNIEEKKKKKSNENYNWFCDLLSNVQFCLLDFFCIPPKLVKWIVWLSIECEQIKCIDRFWKLEKVCVREYKDYLLLVIIEQFPKLTAFRKLILSLN